MTVKEREDILRKVRVLLDKADSTTFPEEADAFRAKADELMLKYAIDSFELDASRPEEREIPIVKRIDVVMADNPVADWVISMFFDVARHTRCRAVTHGSQMTKMHARSMVQGTLVGFPADVEYCEMLFTSLWLQMSRGLEPRPNPQQSFEENVVMMLESGLSRVRIAEIMELPRHPTISKMSKIYKEWCEQNGKPYAGKNTRPNPVTYARNFADGFVRRVELRLAELQYRQGRQVEREGKGIVLYDRSKLVGLAFKEAFPLLGSSFRQRSVGKFLSAAYGRGDQKGREADLGQTKIGGNRKALGGGDGSN